MDALIFIVRTLLQVLLVTVFLLRVLLPLVRADSRNQLCQAVIRFTNPLVLPLRRIFPPAGKVDTASIVALLIVQIAATATLWLLRPFPGVFTPLQFMQVAALDLLLVILQFYFFVLLLYVVLSWVAPGVHSPGAALLASLCEPLLRPIRRVVPPFGGLDLSALLLMIALQALVILVT